MTDILQLAAKGKAEDVLRDMRVRSIFSPYYLTKVVLGYDQLVPHLHQVDTELFLKRWLEGSRKQWIEWPRGFFKTTTFTMGMGIWITLPVSEADSEYAIERLGISEADWFSRVSLHDQDVTQLFAFETIENAKKKVTEVKWHYEENELFRLVFPEIAYQGSESPWNSQCIKIRRIGYGQRVEEGTFEAIGVGGALQSRHYKVVWEDDLIGKRATESQTEMDKTIRWHGLLSGAFENAAQQIRFGVSNRWGYADLNSHVREQEPDFVFYSRSAWEIEPETGKEYSIFPERYPLDKLFDIRDKGSMTRYDFSCQYLNLPVLPGQKELNEDLVHRYTVATDGRIDCSCGAHFYPSQLLRYMHYDPYNAKGVRSNSCPAIVVIGTSSDKHIFLLDYYVAKEQYSKVFDKLFFFNDTWRPLLFTYEDVGAQNLTEHHIREVQSRPGFTHHRFPRIIGVSTHGKAKEIRIREALVPIFEKGKFACRKTHAAFLTQLTTFPMTAPGHDYDLLDAIEDGATLWRFPENEDEIKATEGKEQDVLALLGRPYSHMEARA
jgi:hypothetical protein